MLIPCHFSQCVCLMKMYTMYNVYTRTFCDCAQQSLHYMYHVHYIPNQRGREQKALKALRLVYRLNHLHRGDGSNFRIKSIRVGIRGGDKEGVANRGGDGGGSRIVQRLAKFRRQLVQVRDVCTVHARRFCMTLILWCGYLSLCLIIHVAVVSDEGAVQTQSLPAHSPAPRHHVHSGFWVSH